MSDVEVAALIGIVDQDKDGSISFEEFVRLMTMRLREVGDKKEIKEAFANFDKDGNGFISADELRDVMDTLQAYLCLLQSECAPRQYFNNLLLRFLLSTADPLGELQQQIIIIYVFYWHIHL